MKTVFQVAEDKWGGHPMYWPTPPHRRPWLWQFRARRDLAALEGVFGYLDNDALLRWWRERRKGQSVYEDVGGYLMRCYEAMAGLNPGEPLTYDEAISQLRAAP